MMGISEQVHLLITLTKKTQKKNDYKLKELFEKKYTIISTHYSTFSYLLTLFTLLIFIMNQKNPLINNILFLM